MAVFILVVDQDRILIDLLTQQFRSRRAILTGFTAVPEAAHFIQDIQPEVVLINPTVDSGEGFLEELQRRWPGTAVILMLDSADTTIPFPGTLYAGSLRKSHGLTKLVEAVGEFMNQDVLAAIETTARRILVADDDPDIVQLLSRTLAQRDYIVETALNTEEAFQLVDTAKWRSGR